MDRSIDVFDVKKDRHSFKTPEDFETEANDAAIKKLAENMAETNYNFLNLMVLSIILIFSGIFFTVVSGRGSVDDNNMTMTLKNVLSGHYLQSVEDKFNSNIPYPDTMKALEQRFSLFYGIGNKVTTPLFVDEESANNGRNVIDELGNDDNITPDQKRKENVFTTAQTDENGRAVTTTKKSDDGEKTTTTAISRKDNEETSASTSENEQSGTTNNDAPVVTVTQTEPYQPVTTTPEPVTETTTLPPETSSHQSESNLTEATTSAPE